MIEFLLTVIIAIGSVSLLGIFIIIRQGIVTSKKADYCVEKIGEIRRCYPEDGE
jgi:hypothetical protein